MEYPLKCTSKKFVVVAVTEIKITKIPANYVTLVLRTTESTPTESLTGGTLLYIANHVSYKPRDGVNIYRKFKLKSTFVEIINPKKPNIIVGVIYRHASTDVTDFIKNI